MEAEQRIARSSISRQEFLKMGGAGLVGFVVLGAAGCGGSSGASDGNTVVGFSTSTTAQAYRAVMVERNVDYAEKNFPNVEVIVTDGQDQASKQVTDVDSLISRGISVLLVSPITEDSMTPVIQRAMEQVPVITLDRAVNTEVTMHIGGDNKQMGSDAADVLGKELGGEGNIIEIQGIAGASPTILRHDGFNERLAAEYPNIKIVAQEYADYLRAPALKFMEDQLQRFKPGEIQAVYAHNDEMALGAVQALEAVDRAKGVKTVGIDGQNNAFEAVKEGRLTATVTYPTCAPEGIQKAVEAARGEELPKRLVLEHFVVDESNVDDFLGTGF